MARSYKSALPTWSTYTPVVHPMGVATPINQENFWEKARARHWQPTSIHGYLNKMSQDVAGQVKGTGAGHIAAAGPQYQPIQSRLNKAIVTAGAGMYPPGKGSLWGALNESLNQPNQAAAQVNPANVQVQQQAQQVAGNAAAAVINNPAIGGATPGNLNQVKPPKKQGTP